MTGPETLRDSWEEFVHKCANAYVDGMDERSFGSTLVGKKVHWFGSIERIDLGRGTVIPGFRVRMPMVRIPLPERPPFVADSLFLRIGSPTAIEAARTKKVGDPITFSGRFREQIVFANVRFSLDEEHNEVVLSMGLDDGEIVQ